MAEANLREGSSIFSNGKKNEENTADERGVHNFIEKKAEIPSG